jgi:hypothetical protein
MALEFTTTNRTNVAAAVKVLVYADSGMGKTLMCATAPGPLIISNESGLLVLNKRNLEKLFGVGNPAITYDIPVIKINTVQDLTEAHTWLMQSAEAKQFQTVCVDSISEIGEVVLNNAKRQVKDPRQAYGELIEKMESVIRAYRDIPDKHVYMTAKLEPMKDELTGIVKYGPSMPGAKLGQKLPYFFDEVFKLGVNKDQQGNSFRYLQTSADLQSMAKDRSGALDVMEPPHLAHVFNKILQGAY